MPNSEKRIKSDLENCLMSKGFAFCALVVMFVATIASVAIVATAEDIQLITINGSSFFSSDGKKIAYNNDTGIWIRDLDNENRKKRLTDVGAVLDWSPDDKRIFYVSYTGVSVRSIKSDGSDDRKIIDDFNPFEDRLILNPDGSKIAYTSDNNIYVIDSDGSNKRLISKGIIQSWTHEGRIIFTSDDNVNYSIWEIDLGTSTQNKLGTIAKQKGVSPVVSPDGSKMFYGNTIMNIDGSNRRRLNLPGYPSAPRWSPDSTRISFFIWEPTQRSSNSTIWVVNSDGSGQKKVAELPIWPACRLAWSKDGKKIMYAPYNYENKTTDIYVINVGKASSLKPLADGEPSTPSEEQPGFEVVFAIAGLIAVAYLLRRKK